jgi:hypothetical protein
VELRILRFHLIEHRLAAASHDDLVAEREKLEGKGEADAGGAPVIRMVRPVSFIGILS